MTDATTSPVNAALTAAEQAILQGEFATAIKLYRAILEIDPHHPVAEPVLYKLLECTSQTDLPEMEAGDPPPSQINALHSMLCVVSPENLNATEQACRELLSIYPHSPTIHNILGVVLYRLGRCAEALQAYDMAIRITSDSAGFYNNRGLVLSDFGQFDKASEDYERAIQLKPDFAEAYLNRGTLMNNLGQFDQAITDYEKAIQLKPDFAEAFYNLSLIKRYTVSDPEIESLKQLLANGQLTPTNRVHVCFALARAMENLEEYDRSFDYLTKGNDLRKKELKYQIDSHRQLALTAKVLFPVNAETATVASMSEDSSQPLFIVGMPRSGTTLAEQILASHSRVHGAGELGVCEALAKPLLMGRYDPNAQTQCQPLSQQEIQSFHCGYLDVITALDVPEQLIIDKMPLNFFYLGFIFTAFPEAKVVHCNRDARATCWSNYKTHFSSGGNGYAYDLNDLSEFYHLYLDLMTFWREHYPDRIYDLNYEQLTANQEAETRQLLAHCDLAWEPQCLDFPLSRRPVGTASSYQVRQPMYRNSSQAWRKYEAHLKPLLKSLGY